VAFLLKRQDGRDIAKKGTVPFKTGRMVSLVRQNVPSKYCNKSRTLHNVKTQEMAII
jgi:hypothetical protein